MNSHERVLTALKGKLETIDRLPAFNSVGTYTHEGMKAFDAFWPEAHRNPVKMAKLASALHKLAGLESLVVPFELTLEAEVLGAPVDFFEDTIKWPSVTHFIANDPSDLILPSETKDIRQKGRVSTVCRAIELMKGEFGARVPVIAYVCSPFESISSYLVDSVEFLKKCRAEPETIQNLMEAATPVYAEIARSYKDAGADIITFREESISLNNIHPQCFDELVQPYLKDLIDSVEPPRILHACGQLWSPKLEVISKLVKCGAEALTVDESTSLREAKETIKEAQSQCLLGGNISAYRTIHQGPAQRIWEGVKRSMEQGADLPMPGCDFWLETPTEHVKAFVEAVHQHQPTIDGLR